MSSMELSSTATDSGNGVKSVPRSVASNRSHFNNIATQYDDRQGALRVSRAIAGAIIKEYDFDENSTVMMEYACGTGMISRELSPYAKQIVGIDVSQGMVDQFNARVGYQDIPPEEMQALCLELEGVDSELDGKKFDVIVCCMAYHHFPDLDATTRTLAFFLKPGGSLIVVDLIKRSRDNADPTEDDQQMCHGQVVAHKGGIDEPLISSAFNQAGLQRYKYKPCVRIASKKGEDRLFLARGMKQEE